jgi:hypothetical protein
MLTRDGRRIAVSSEAADSFGNAEVADASVLASRVSASIAQQGDAMTVTHGRSTECEDKYLNARIQELDLDLQHRTILSLSS